MYIFSDILYVLVYYIFRYRRKLCRKNLCNAFPDRSNKEILGLEKKFYRHFCDYFVETLKLLHISEEEMKSRFIFKNPEIIDCRLKEGKSVILMLGHYGNWEWVTSIKLWMKTPDVAIGQIYRPLKNKTADRFFYKLRTQFHTINIAKNDTLREIVKLRRAGKNFLLGFISDQKPSKKNIHYWTTFLNQDTAVLTGAERIAKQTGASLAYLDVRRIKRGYYEAEIILMSDDPKASEEFALTEQYIRMMETTILRDPAYYLWTHNRWKDRRNEEMKEMKE